MPELWLIAHKVRGEAAFDIAQQMECSICESDGCSECDGTGYWWIIPTSGHRAYPYWSRPLDYGDCPEMPDNLPDHYQTRAEPSRLEQLKAMLPPPKPIHRRF